MSNYTPETAIGITTTPYVTTQSVSDAPTGTGYASSCLGTQYFAVWYAYRTRSTQTVFSVGANSGGYDPVVSVWTGALGALAEYAVSDIEFCRDCTGGFYLEVPCSPDTTYYVQIEGATATTPTDDLTVRLVSAPRVVAPINAIVITDETDGFPAIAFSITDGTIYGFLPLPAGEAGTQLPRGIIGVMNGSTGSDPTSLRILTSQCVTVATVDLAPNLVRQVTSDRLNTFYVVTQAPGFFVNTVWAVSAGGVVGSQWTLPDLASLLPVCAVSLDGGIFYSATSGDQVQRYDLVNDVPLTEWPLTFAGEDYVGNGCGVVDADGNVWIGYHGAGANNLRQFDPDGVVLQTIDLTSADFVTFHRYAIDGAGTGIVCWGHGAGSTVGYNFRRVAISDGTITATSPVMPSMSESGMPKQPGQPFAVSSSCPIFALTVAYTPPAPAPPSREARAIRRLRRFPLPFETNLQLFLGRLEIYLQSGMGLTTGQGADPVLMLRLSRDGGATWGDELQMGMGRIGQYDHRAYVSRLGRGRNFVAEVTCSDPVFCALIDCFVEMTEGTS